MNVKLEIKKLYTSIPSIHIFHWQYSMNQKLEINKCIHLFHRLRYSINNIPWVKNWRSKTNIHLIHPLRSQTVLHESKHLKIKKLYSKNQQHVIKNRNQQLEIKKGRYSINKAIWYTMCGGITISKNVTIYNIWQYCIEVTNLQNSSSSHTWKSQNLLVPPFNIDPKEIHVFVSEPPLCDLSPNTYKR